MGRQRRPTDLSDHDLALWREVVRHAKPLKGRALRSGTALRQAERAEPTAAPAQPPASGPRPSPPRAHPTVAPPPAELAHGAIADLDRRSAERLRRGKLAIEATLDLHGLTQAEARPALDAFLAASQARGRRCVLIITGKGAAREDSGVLRRQVPLWLNQPPNRARILAFDYAQPRHGGAGALYVLLRRRRDGA